MSRPIERNVFTPPAWELAACMGPNGEFICRKQPLQPQSEGSVEHFLLGQRPVQGLWAKRLAAAAIIIGMFAIVAYMIWWQIPEVKTQNTCYDWYVNKHPEQIGLLLMAQQANKFFNQSTDFNDSLTLPLQVP